MNNVIEMLRWMSIGAVACGVVAAILIIIGKVLAFLSRHPRVIHCALVIWFGFLLVLCIVNARYGDAFLYIVIIWMWASMYRRRQRARGAWRASGPQGRLHG